ncbi:hypothetical protein IFR04_001244 [Cadophora malorum]|uniref:2EXR domain-containing protein n=1 Tax=Cadophora malorum TaxID=108018 RepID=A0A8H7WIS1_9HELO|nr:hypothetical protein IFR04_001244 [Cadophora malorum]
MASVPPKTSSNSQGSALSSSLAANPVVAPACAFGSHLPSLGINPNNPKNEFKRFPKMPLELHRKCFRRMFRGPRTVEVLFAQKTGSEKHEFLADTPIVLFICKESRQEALSFYTLAFGGKHTSNPVYFDPKSDTLYLRDLCYPRRQDRVHPQMFLQQLPSKDMSKS